MAHDDLAGITASRICHDLISPIGALSNGLELAREGDQMDRNELSLIETCAEAANATLKFYRLAFGAAPSDDVVSSADVTAIVAPFLIQKKVELGWPDETQRRADVKLGLLLLLCLIDALPRGGVVRRLSGAEIGWIATGPRILPDRLSVRLDAAEQGDRPTPGDVHFRLMLDEARKRGLKNRCGYDEATAEITLALS